MARGKSINLFLMDGDVNGRIKCTLANWTGLAYKIPRTMLERGKSIEALMQTGIYLLFGYNEQTESPVVYVGQAGVRKNGKGLLNRINEHVRDKDYWTEAVAVTTSNNSFGPTEISYLENSFTNLALRAERYEVKNGNDPSVGNVTEEKEAELEEFIEYSRLIIGALGYKVFELILHHAPEPEIVQSEPSDTILHFENKNVKASGKQTTDGFVVLAGSRLSLSYQKSCPANAKKLREKYREQITPEGFLTESVLCNSPSNAAGFVALSSLSGNVVWRTVDGRTLPVLEAEAAEQAQPLL